jgi:hypothetical protein
LEGKFNNNTNFDNNDINDNNDIKDVGTMHLVLIVIHSSVKFQSPELYHQQVFQLTKLETIRRFLQRDQQLFQRDQPEVRNLPPIRRDQSKSTSSIALTHRAENQHNVKNVHFKS